MIYRVIAYNKIIMYAFAKKFKTYLTANKFAIQEQKEIDDADVAVIPDKLAKRLYKLKVLEDGLK